MSKDAYYFSHDSNAHTDPKILKLRMSLGWEGYGIYWAIIENLRNQETYSINEGEFMFLTLSLAIDEAKLKQILTKCLEVNLLELSEGNIYSPSLLKRMEKADGIRNKRREAGSKGGKAKAKAIAELKQNSSIKGKETKRKETKLKETKVFNPPTPKEFYEYCKSEGYAHIAENAFKGYEAGDWHDTHGNKIKNWKQKLQNGWFKNSEKQINTSGLSTRP